MAGTAQARRYAQAVFQIAREADTLDRWQADLSGLGHLERENILIRALEMPNLVTSDKARLVSELFPDMNPLALNLVCLLAEKGRVGLLPAILEEYQRLLDAHRGIQRAEVITAVPLDDEARTQIERQLAATTGKTMVITTRVDPDIVGGIVARFDGKVLDGSTRSRLETLKKEISQIPR